MSPSLTDTRCFTVATQYRGEHQGLFGWVTSHTECPVSSCSVWRSRGCIHHIALAQSPLEFGIHRVDVTPELREGQPVWLAGYGWGRQATGVHDPLYATCVVLADGKQKLALVTIDVVGLQLPTVGQVRSQLTDFAYVLISSTHNHEGPDTIGLWGKTPLQRGVDDKYLDRVVRDIVAGVRQAEQQRVPVRVGYGTACDESLLGDSRQPVVKDGVLRVLRFERIEGGDWAGLLVQWNCHPEAMGPRNTLITADFPAATIARLSDKFRCPVAYFTGAVGGLLAPPDGIIQDEQGHVLQEGDFEYARRYGEAVADLAARAAHDAQPLQLTPFRVAAQPVAIPVANSLYRTASLVGLLRRPWQTPLVDPPQPDAAARKSRELAVTTEVAYLRLGELSVACIPGELYPELVYGKFQEPVDPARIIPTRPWRRRSRHCCPMRAGCCWDWRTTRSATSFPNASGI